MRSGVSEQRGLSTAFDLALGSAGVVVAAFGAAVLFRPGEPGDRAMVVAIGVAVVAAIMRDWRATAGITVLAALTFVGFLAHRAGQLTGDPAPWRYTPIIIVAALAGRAVQVIRAALRRRTRSGLPAMHEVRRLGGGF
jgi:hypothetical protein